MTLERFTLERGHWYGLTMFPGYVDCPYHSPIRVDAVRPIGNRQFDLEFLTLAYAAGVSDFTRRFRTLRRARSHLVAEETEIDDRTYVMVAFSKTWLEACFPDLEADRYFDADGRPNGPALLGLAGASWERGRIP